MSHSHRTAVDTPAHAHTHAPGHRNRWKLLALLGLAQFMLVADVTVTNVALPTIARQLSLSPSSLTWVVTAYTLGFGSLLLLGGRLADATGRLVTLRIGVLVFTAASLASGLAAGGDALIASRAAQGIGAALLSPAAMSLVTTLFQGPERTRALGVWGAIGGAGSAVGVLLGGLLVAGPGWRWIFFINLPVGLAVLLAVPLLLSDPDGRALAGRPATRTAMDLPGALTLTAGPALLIYGLVQAREHGWTAPGVWIPIAASAVSVVAFVMIERRVREPLVRLDLLTRRPLVGGSLVMLAATGLLISAFFLNSFYAQQLLGYSALRTGLLFLPVAVAITLGAQLSAHAVGRLGWRPVAASGFLLAAGGEAWLTGLSAHSNAWTALAPGFLLLALGLGSVFVTATTAAMAGMEHRDAGLASGLVSTAHELGASLGVAVIAAIAGASLRSGPGPAPITGFTHAYTASAAIALAVAALAVPLLPKGRPEPGRGPAFAH